MFSEFFPIVLMVVLKVTHLPFLQRSMTPGLILFLIIAAIMITLPGWNSQRITKHIILFSPRKKRTVSLPPSMLVCYIAYSCVGVMQATTAILSQECRCPVFQKTLFQSGASQILRFTVFLLQLLQWFQVWGESVINGPFVAEQ